MKKLLLTLSSISLTVIPSLNIISCQTKNDDEDYFIPTEQPKNIEEIEESAKIATDKSEDFKINLEKEWSEYKIKIDFENMTEEEQEIERTNFSFNSNDLQKDNIYRFWLLIYSYKVFQFNEEYSNEFKTDKGRTVRLSARNKNEFEEASKIFFNNKYSNKQTKEHFNKMYNWAIQDNPNVSE
ncbi:hypothetical protein [Spiroplasma endosymbiont of Cantharis rufa]|uniref:hypothetical protein n=1 Tax=Spiroplasma endosymbiont of Cantharis rufa TaxID=3066279 RepID=UPI0030CAB15C